MNKKGLLIFVLLLLLRPANNWAAACCDYEGALAQAGEEIGIALGRCDGLREMELAFSSPDEPRGEKKVKKIVIMGSDKPRLGLLLRREFDSDTDGIGAEVQGVTPHGPADEAGIKAGDIITKLNGESLSGRSAEAEDDESGPAAKLVAFAGKLKEGDKVTLEYKRGKETHTATLTAKKIGGGATKGMAGPNAKKKMVFIGEDKEGDFGISELENLPDMLSFCWEGGGWLDMELVAMNPGLGEYFGTSEGILVVKAADNSPLQLKSGDVILKIGDRSPKTPSQAIRIIRSYESGEEISLQVMRKNQRQSLKAKAPEHKEDFDFDYFDSDDPMMPPPPPPPPAPRGASKRT